ncbi:hypothetical protein DL766_001941 [Monosporascus sp. MC13-8B]|nr:hypothetical protein DL763_003363 [Monosporascus cannonballus]RYP36565.1 hypothetical protein DL766_001941 [Monosporascus sp. MC13-8B]
MCLASLRASTILQVQKITEPIYAESAKSTGARTLRASVWASVLAYTPRHPKQLNFGKRFTTSVYFAFRVLQTTLAEIASRNSTEVRSEDATEACCVICLDSISEVCEARPCHHRDFDYLCLLNWLQQQPKCPLCKCNVREVRYGFQGDVTDEYEVYVVPPAKEPTKPQQHGPSQPQPRVVRPLNHANAFRRRRLGERVPSRPATEDEALLRRQRVYRDQLYSLHVGSSPRTGYRDLTPQAFDSDPELVSRARRWLRRELQVFEFLRSLPTAARSSGDRLTRRRANNAEFLLEYVVAILKTVDMQGSQGQAEEMLKDFLGRENTRLLLHELKSFLRSPHSLEVWDRKVQYPNAKRRTRDDDNNEDGDHVRGRSPNRRRLASKDAEAEPRRSRGHGSDHGDENQQPGNDLVDSGNHQAEHPRTASVSSWATTTSNVSLPGTEAAEQQPRDLVTARKWVDAEAHTALAKMKDLMKKNTKKKKTKKKKIMEKLHQQRNNTTIAPPPASPSTKHDNSTAASTPAEAAALAADLSQRAAVWHHPRCRPAQHPAVDAALNNFVRHLGEAERRGCPRAAEHGRKLANDAYEELEMMSGRRRETASAAFFFRLLELYIYDDEEEEG